jgi:hypothetical protein
MRPTFINRSLLGALTAGVMLGTFAPPTMALEVTQHAANDSADVNAILLKGRIEEGDTFDLQVYIAGLPKKPNIVVYLNSPGGNLREGMRLGTFFHQNKIETVVESKTGCTSACALAFLGGRDNATGKARRTKFSTAGLGFHSFTREFNKDRSYTADDLKLIIRRTQIEVVAVAEYLRSIGTDLDLLRVMLRAASNEMNYLSNDAAIGLNIRIWDEKRSQIVEPELVMDRLDRSRATAAGTAPAAPGGAAPTATAAPQSTSSKVASGKAPS